MSKKKALDASILTAAVVGSLVLVNVIGLGLFHRFDLTRDDQFTLSEATRTSLAALKDPITIRAYFTKDLPPPHSTNARFVKDLLEEYYAAGHGKVRYEMIDPTSEETDADKEKKKDVQQDMFGRAVREETSVEKELRELGVPPVQVRVNEGDKLEVKRAYMGIVVQYQDKKEVLPLVADTAGLEYDLTTIVRKVSREKAPKIAMIGGHEGPDPDREMTHFVSLLKQLYEVTNVDLSQQPQVPEDVDALLVVGPKTAFSDAEKQAIDKFVVSGRSAAFLLGPVAPDMRTLQANPTEHGLNDLLAGYGVKIGDGLVLDAECATITVSQMRGFMQIAQPVRYPFFPTPASLDPNHPLTRGLSQVAFPFMSPLELALPQGSAVKGEVIASSSKLSWIQSPPFNLDPFQKWTRDQVKDEGPKGLLVTLQGAIKSHYAAPDAPASTASSRVLVAGGYGFVLDSVMSKGNEVLALNLLDWLVQDEALLAVRARGMAAAPLDTTISDTRRNVAKYANIAGLPLAFIAFGIVRWRLRESRRRKVAL